MQSKYDIAIIGSGLGGLVCGYILSKNGYKIAIFEQGAQPGGCLQTFQRNGVKFETGVHYIGSMGEGQALNSFFRYLSLLPDIKVMPLDPSGFDVISFRGEKYQYAAGYDNFVETLAQKFPAEHDNLKRYATAMQEVARSSPFHSISNLTKQSSDFSSQMNPSNATTCVNEFIASFTSDETLQNVLAGTIPLYAGVKDKTPLYVHSFINDSNISGACRIMGGSDQIAESLVRSIRSFGGDVFTLCKVNKINCDSQKATSITLEDGTQIVADNIISNTHPEVTVRMIDSHIIRPAYRNRIRQMEQTISNFTVYLKFKKNAVPYMNYNYFHYNHDQIWEGEKYTVQNWPHGYLYMHLCPFELSQYAQAGEIITFMRFDEVAQWAGTKVEHRGEAYREFKRRKADKILEQLERDFPGTISNMETCYTSSPLTYADYTGTKDGAMYGVLRDINAPRIVHRTRIPNLFLTGQNTNAHGIMGVIVGALITCSEFLGREFILKQISKIT